MVVVVGVGVGVLLVEVEVVEVDWVLLVDSVETTAGFGATFDIRLCRL